MSRLPKCFCVVKHEEADPQKFFLVSDVGESYRSGDHIFAWTFEDTTIVSNDDDAVLYETIVTDRGQRLNAPAFEDQLVRMIESGRAIMRSCDICKHKLACLIEHTCDVRHKET